MERELKLMSKKTKCAASLLLLLATSACHAQTQTPANLPTGAKLQDIPVFVDRKSSEQVQPTGGATVAHEADNSLPVDAAQKHDGLPSLKVETGGGESGSWQALFAFMDWRTFDLTPYREHGFLEFNVRGANGGETFALSFSGRRGSQFPETAPVPSANFGAVTKDWQAVRVPLKTLIPDASAFPIGATQRLTLLKVGAASQTFWLNNVRFTSPDAEPNFPAIKINEVGYLPDCQKIALISGSSDALKIALNAAFQVLKTDGSVAFSGELELLTENDEVSGDRIYRADFSALKTSGRYILDVPGIGTSAEFRIGAGIYKPLLRDALRYYYFQRSGTPLEKRYAGIFARGEGHPQDRALPFQSDPNGPKRDVHGGWYDAGDYGKYVSMAAKPVSDLLWAYEAFPVQFPDKTSDIPESGNGIPDLLDEVRWELDWMQTMQDAESGGFYQKVWPNNAGLTPDKDAQPRFIYDKVGTQGHVRPTAATAAAVAVFAHASILYRKFDPQYAATLLAKARKGWAYLEANPGNIVATGMTGAIDDDRPYRLWATGELFRATNDAKIEAYFLSHYAALDKVWKNDYGVGYGDDMGVLGWIAYLKTAKPDGKARAWFAENFNHWRGVMQKRMASGAWRNYLLESNYFWGSNSVMADTQILRTLGERALGEDGAARAAQIETGRNCLNYLLGVNPLAISYVSGSGANCVKHIYSCIYSSDGIDAIPAGYVPGGPNKYDAKFVSRYAGKCYCDSEFDWTINENAIYYTSPVVFLAALAQSESK